MNDINYWDRLTVLKLYSLERRREMYIIMYVFKILKELVPNPNSFQIGTLLLQLKKRERVVMTCSCIEQNYDVKIEVFKRGVIRREGS